MRKNSLFDKVVELISNPKISPTLSEGLILESRIDSVIRRLVIDIVKILKKKEEGFFDLPNDLDSEEIYYNFKQFSSDFSIELNIKFDNNSEDFEIDGNFYKDELVLEINLVLNEQKLFRNLQNIIGSLNELMAHELTHLVQFERGDELPEEEPKDNLEYYLQNHELEAQYRGFNRRAKLEKRSIDSVMDEWFLRNQKIHNLSPEQIETLKKAIINWEFN